MSGEMSERRSWPRLMRASTALLVGSVIAVLCQSCCVAQDPEGDGSTTTVTSVVVKTKLGKVEGVREMGMDFFGGIPYAAPPVGSLRWAAPEEPSPWKPHILDATRFGPDCWQMVDPVMNPGSDEAHMSEDCLYLNIYTPPGHSSRNNKLLPVMVWLHGGAFQQGGARRPEYDGRHLAGRGMVVVTLNYRLGALGFMVSSEDGLFGNFGLQDQRAALHFLKDNIKSFGGDPSSITLFGESAGGVMIGLHLLMDNSANTDVGGGSAGSGSQRNQPDAAAKNKLFHRAIIQSNPMGYQFRSVVVADFIGAALKRSIDCRDLDCLRSEPVEDIMKAQSTLMGIPRSVGDFFTWGPTLTEELQVTIGGSSTFNGRRLSDGLPNMEHKSIFRVESYHQQKNRASHKFSVNVTQPLTNLDLIPDEIPIIIGTNAHEGEMFVHGAFPLTMSKVVYWMFVGALFKDSAGKVLKHYRPYVEQIEMEARAIAEKQIEEEENRQYYMENQEELENEYELLRAIHNDTSAYEPQLVSDETVERLVQTFSLGGAQEDLDAHGGYLRNDGAEKRGDAAAGNMTVGWHRKLWPFGNNADSIDEDYLYEQQTERQLERERKRKERQRARALKEAAKVVVDYRPVMSRIIGDYLFRCPTWHFAHLLSRKRVKKGKDNNVYVYRFSQPTHIPGFKECWGKSCHTAELPYTFEAMDLIRTNYSTLSAMAQEEAPEAPEYPYTDILNAYRGLLVEEDDHDDNDGDGELGAVHAINDADDGTVYGGADGKSSQHIHQQQTPTLNPGRNATSRTRRSFQRMLKSLFGDYFSASADQEVASDMAERWVAFARNGNPNYDGSKVRWVPWRYIPKDGKLNEKQINEFLSQHSDSEGEGGLWDDFDEADDGDGGDGDGFFWGDDGDIDDEDGGYVDDRAYRRRALYALRMQVAEEDLLRTELKRSKGSDHDAMDSLLALKFLYNFGVQSKDNKGKHKIPRSIIRQVQRIAQDMGVLGTGLRTDDRRGNSLQSYWDDDFFPQLLELKSPPEERLVERDCTCDFWQKIRYRY